MDNNDVWYMVLTSNKCTALVEHVGDGRGSACVECQGYVWTSLVAHVVKNPPEMQETQVCFLDQKDPLEKGMATHSSILAWRIP